MRPLIKRLLLLYIYENHPFAACTAARCVRFDTSDIPSTTNLRALS